MFGTGSGGRGGRVSRIRRAGGLPAKELHAAIAFFVGPQAKKLQGGTWVSIIAWEVPGRRLKLERPEA
jgi:hypothetical protein